MCQPGRVRRHLAGTDLGHEAQRAARLVVYASGVCVEALRPFTDRDWRSITAQDLEWSVWDTMVHVNDDLYFYAAQILLADEDDYICFELSADDHATPERLLTGLAAQGSLLAAVVAAADPGSRAHHVYGASDASGFAAMGVVETLVHTYDALHGLDDTSTWKPPDELATPVLERLFPHAPPAETSSAGELLLYMCGRIPLRERPRLAEWRWYGASLTAPPRPQSEGGH